MLCHPLVESVHPQAFPDAHERGYMTAVVRKILLFGVVKNDKKEVSSNKQSSQPP